MTTINEAREAVYKKFSDEWPAASSSVPFRFDGEVGFTPPEAANAADPATWVRLSVRNETSAQETLGEKPIRKFARGARIYLQIFTKSGSARKVSDLLASAVVGIFEGERFDGLVVGAGTPRELGPSNGWDMLTVDFPLQYFETH